MSDSEVGLNSRNRSMSPRGKHDELSDEESKVVSYRSRSKEMDKYDSRSPKSKHRYSQSRSRSRSRRRSRRSRSKYRSRSRSHGRYRSKYSHSLSRSRSHSSSPYRSRKNYRSSSRSPMSNRKRHNGTRENPKPSKCLGVFGLSIYTTESHLQYIFSKFGSIARVQVVIDAKTGRSRGFAFVYFDTVEDAKNAKEHCIGMEIDGRQIRVDFSITQRAHTPTPGIYMGKPTYSDTKWRDDDYYGGGRRGGYDRYRRTPSPYYRRSRRHDRSRSRSYSPRRYY